MKPVIVEWEDSQSSATMTWEGHGAEPLGPAIVQTVGFLVRDDAKGVELVMGYHEGEQCGRWFIPRGCIVAMRYLQTGNQLVAKSGGLTVGRRRKP